MSQSDRGALPEVANRLWMWAVRGVAVIGLALIGWIVATAWPAVVHGHPAYAVMLAVTVLAGALWAATTFRAGQARFVFWRTLLRTAMLMLAGLWLGVVMFLRPFPAEQPAMAAMTSDDTVAVAESATRIELRPQGSARPTGVFFQPGARVDPRAYAAVLRPVAEAGYPVVIAKQPLGLALLADGAFERARSERPQVTAWVVGGHSLGGVVASTDAAEHDTAEQGKVAGLLLYASYPAADLSTALSCPVLSLSGSADGLATPAKVAATKEWLPPGTTYTTVEGAVHAFFGDYGVQPGDGTPTISHDQAREQISAATLAFVEAAAGRTA